MDIYYISFNRMPSRGTHTINIMNTCASFASISGINVTLFINKNDSLNTFIKESIWDFYGVKNNFNLVYFPFKKSIFHRIFFMKQIQAYLFIIKNFIKIFIDANEQFIIYSRNSRIGNLFSFYQKLFRNSNYYGFYYEAHALSKKRRLSKCCGIVAISEKLKSDLIKMKLVNDHSKVLVAHDGVDSQKLDASLDLHKIREALKIPSNSKIITYTGRINEAKGAGVLIEAFKKISKKNRAVLILVGKLYTLGMEKYLSELDENVIFVDFIPASLVFKYQICSDILVLPSTKKLNYAKYSSPIKLFEYMAAKKPIIASNLEGISEIIKDGYNGILYNADDSDDLAKKLQYLLKNKTISENIAEQAWIDVHNYTWDKRAEKIVAFIMHTIYTSELKLVRD